MGAFAAYKIDFFLAELRERNLDYCNRFTLQMRPRFARPGSPQIVSYEETRVFGREHTSLKLYKIGDPGRVYLSCPSDVFMQFY